MRPQARAAEQSGAQASANVVVARQDFVRSVRLNGTVEAVEATSIAAPRLSGQNNNSLVIMRLIKAGTTVKPGDPLDRVRPPGADPQRRSTGAPS